MENEQYAHPFNFWRINYGNRICSCGKSEDDEIHVDSVVLRKQIETILIGHANDIGESDFADGKHHKKITNKAVDAVFSLITGETK